MSTNEEKFNILQDYLKKLQKKYGPTFTVEASVSERRRLVALREAINFSAFPCDQKLC